MVKIKSKWINKILIDNYSNYPANLPTETVALLL